MQRYNNKFYIVIPNTTTNALNPSEVNLKHVVHIVSHQLDQFLCNVKQYLYNMMRVLSSQILLEMAKVRNAQAQKEDKALPPISFSPSYDVASLRS